MRALFSLLLLSTALFGEAIPVQNHCVHEAYMQRDQDTIILEAVPIQPPAEITERIPKKPAKEDEAVWIEGYWAWSKEKNQFIWISGTWRVPPPAHEWVKGKWKQFDEGWVWLHGFWSPQAEKDFSYIQNPPPDRVDENVGTPPGTHYFWLPGHWIYSNEASDFVWFTGRWQEFDEKWQYVPARYIWREKGYIFIDGFWDWSLEERGVVYSAVEIPKDEIETIAYMPKSVVSPSQIYRTYYPFWPDYFMTFHFWFHWHPNFDFGLGAVPDWWSWSGWWAFNNVDLWWLWWWWSHPGYPHPFFLNGDLVNQIVPPGELVLQKMQNVEPLSFMAPSGMIDIQDLVHAIMDYTGHSDPILPSSPEDVFEIQEEARPAKRPMRVLKPEAANPPLMAPEKPFFGPSRDDFSQPTQPTKEPAYPHQRIQRRAQVDVVKPPQPVKKPMKRYDEEEDPVESVPQAPQNGRTRRAYPRSTNARERPPYPESYQPKPRYAPQAQSYRPRKTPETYTPQTPSKPKYQPRTQSAPHPSYTAPSKQPENRQRCLNQ